MDYLSLLLVCLIFGVVARATTVPSSWQMNTVNVTRAERIQKGQALIQYLLGSMQSDGTFQGYAYWDSGHILRQISQFDSLTGSKNYQSEVLSALIAANQTHTNFTGKLEGADIQPIWGLACMAAYYAYGNAAMLELAKSIWDYANQFRISQLQARPGIDAIPGQCNASTAGAVLTNVPNVLNTSAPLDAHVDSRTMTTYVIFSSHLYLATQLSMYKDGAVAAMTFMPNILQDNLALSEIELSKCIVTLKSPIEPWESSDYLNALALVANITGDPTYSDMMMSVFQTLTTTAYWNDEHGILKDSGANGLYVLDISEAMHFQPTNPDFTQLATAYLSNQYNAFLTNAPVSNQSYYPFWNGTPTKASLTGQLSALGAFNVGIALPLSTQATSQSKLFAIVGGIAGGGVFLLLCFLAIWFTRRHKRHSYLVTSDEKTALSTLADPIHPFTYDSHRNRHRPQSASSTKWRSTLILTAGSRSAAPQSVLDGTLQSSTTLIQGPGPKSETILRWEQDRQNSSHDASSVDHFEELRLPREIREDPRLRVAAAGIVTSASDLSTDELVAVLQSRLRQSEPPPYVSAGQE